MSKPWVAPELDAARGRGLNQKGVPWGNQPVGVAAQYEGVQRRGPKYVIYPLCGLVLRVEKGAAGASRVGDECLEKWSNLRLDGEFSIAILVERRVELRKRGSRAQGP